MKQLLRDKKKLPFMIGGCLIIVIIIGVLVFNGLNSSNKPNVDPNEEIPNIIDEGTHEKPDETTGLAAIEIDLVEYSVYKLDGVDFQFVLAKFRVKGKEALNIDLQEFTTSEGIVLSNVDKYLAALEEQSLYVGRKNVVFEIASIESSTLVTLFIPVSNKTTQSIDLKTPLDQEKVITFDLTKNLITKKDDLIYQATDVITDGKTYKMTVSTVFPITGETMYHDGVEETYPSTAELHAFQIQINSLWGDEVVIEEAKYVVDGSSLEFEALDGNYSTEKRNNILNVTVKENDTGYLMFMTLNPEQEPITYKGKIYLKIKGNPNWIAIQVDL